MRRNSSCYWYLRHQACAPHPAVAHGFNPTGEYEDEEEDPCQECDERCSPYCINRCDHNDSCYGCGDCYEYRSEFCFEECEYNSGYKLVHPCNADEVDFYEANLYSSAQAERLPCSARSIIYCPTVVAGLAALLVKQHAIGKSLLCELLLDLPSFKLHLNPT